MKTTPLKGMKDILPREQRIREAEGEAEALLTVQKAQAALHAGRDGGPLGRRLAILPEAGHLHVNDLLAQCQESLDYMVSPPLVLNWLATRLHIVYRHARLRGRKPTA